MDIDAGGSGVLTLLRKLLFFLFDSAMYLFDSRLVCDPKSLNINELKPNIDMNDLVTVHI